MQLPPPLLGMGLRPFLLVVALGVGCGSSASEVAHSSSGSEQARTFRWTRPDGVEQQQILPPRHLESCGLDGNVGNCECDEDSDCSQRRGGQCHAGSVLSGVNPGIVQRCFYPECSVDADCGDEQVCIPAQFYDPVGRCVPASCRSNADCGEGGRAGRCTVLPTVTLGDPRPQAHCVYPETSCEAGCPPQLDSSGGMRGQSCVFVNGSPRCVPVPDPPP